MRCILLLIIIVSGCSPASASTESGRAAEIAQTISRLRQIRTGDYDPLPVSATPLLTQLKRQLRELILETINVSDAQVKLRNSCGLV
ncbi:MAG TPA: hypothetical protein VNQ79_21210 [Blastocatellia bacterium]|nr:hypothetical protein [Blastocatellia bacterium]